VIKFNEKDGLMIKGGNVDVLLTKLKELDATLITYLKNNKDTGDMRYYQGAASVADSIRNILQ
jgi:hypothetical protein